LLSNAIKYSPEGGLVEVALSWEEEPQGARVTIQVRDHGLGVPANELERVFERFVRGSNVVGRIKGTGIGLAGVRQIVEQHDGTVALASQEGVGTTATIRLPHRPAAQG
jgi:signal transduction histidine kinase